MALDLQQFAVQSCASLIGGLLGVSLGAWLAGIYKIKGELTGRSEMLDTILKEVRGTAKATELSKIEARGEKLNELVSEVARSTAASEGAKIATRLEKLDQILPEVQAVTEAQKRIESTIAGGEWDRQWRLNQTRDAYSRLLAAVAGLQDAYYFADNARNSVGNLDAVARSEAREEDLLYRKYAAEFKIAAALTRIFAGPRAAFALDQYEDRIQARRHLPSAPKQAVVDLNNLYHELLNAAKADLHIEGSSGESDGPSR